MKGVIFNLLERFIVDGWGDAVYEEILAGCPLHTQGVYVGPATYPDADLFAIVGKACERLGLPAATALHAFGRYLAPRLAARVPGLVAGHAHPKTLLQAIDSVIHVEVRKLFKDAQPPRLTWTDPGPDELVLHYASARPLCGLVGGLIEGTGELFSVPLTQTQVRCRDDGAATCDFEVRFGAASGLAA